MKYFWLSFNDQEIETVAYAPEGTPLSHKLVSEVCDREIMPFALELHKVMIETELSIGPVSSKHYDYQANSLAWPLMSDSLREIIDSNLTGKEDLKWIKANVVGELDTIFLYNIPLFHSYLETLDLKQSINIPASGMVIKPVFSLDKVRHYSVFHGHSPFWKISSKFYVNEAIKESIIQNGLTGISFSEIAIS